MESTQLRRRQRPMGAFHLAGTKSAWVAIDVAKSRHVALLETQKGARRRLSVENTLEGFKAFGNALRPHRPCEVALEPTGDYHRPLANFLIRQGHHVHF